MFAIGTVAVITAVVAASAAGAWLVGGSSFPQWLEATSTLAALITAAWAVFFAAGALRIERAREDAAHEARGAAQAGLFVGWIDQPNHLADRLAEVEVVVHNMSSSPIYEVSFNVFVGDIYVSMGQGVGQVNPSPHPTVLKFHEAMRQAVAEALTRYTGGPFPSVLRADFRFTDARNQDWVLTADGRLVSIFDRHDELRTNPFRS